MARVPLVTLSQDVRKRQLVVQFPNQSPIPFFNGLDQAKIHELQRTLRDLLEIVAHRFDFLRLNLSMIQRLYNHGLCNFARNFSNQLGWLDNCQDVIHKIEQHCRRYPDHPPLIEIQESFENYLPWELLPLRKEMGQSGPESPLKDVCGDLLGFSALIRRSMTNVVQDQGDPLRTPPVPAKWCVDNQFRDKYRAKPFFHCQRQIDPDPLEPWPNQRYSKDECLHELTALLCNPQPHEILHFDCHGSVANQLYQGTQLHLRSPEPTYDLHMLTLNEIEQGMNGCSADRLPFVFMNACSSFCIVPGQPLSFAYLFLRHRYRGFIGIQASIPKEVGAVFPRLFYRRLVRQHRPLMDALFWARWDLAKVYNNPLGILYSSYASPELCVERPRG
jgi:CHAT domain